MSCESDNFTGGLGGLQAYKTMTAQTTSCLSDLAHHWVAAWGRGSYLDISLLMSLTIFHSSQTPTKSVTTRLTQETLITAQHGRYRANR